MTIVPDAFFTLVLPDGTEQQVILEIDMGTLAQRRLRAKLRGYLLAVKGPIPVLFVVPGPSRQAQMARYAQEEAHADDHLLAACLGGKADYLVTGDADLLSLDRHPKLPNLRIIAVRPFLHLLTTSYTFQIPSAPIMAN
jgi:hypothetical protein